MAESLKRFYVEIYTDGSSLGNPGPGGYGAILRYRKEDGTVLEKELSGSDPETTNNRMELGGAIAALSELKQPCVVDLYSDSKYLVDAFEKGWVRSWLRNGWRKADKKPVLNDDLWKELLSVMDGHEVRFHWVEGHKGHPENERCDQLAREAASIVAGNNL